MRKIILLVFFFTLDTYAASNVEKDNALKRAAVWCDTGVVESLLKEGANPDGQTMDDTPLMGAATKPMAVSDIQRKPAEKCTEVVKLLISAGANVNAVGEHGRTVLIHAVMADYNEIVKLLIEAKVNVHAKDSNGKTPLMWAADTGANAEIVKLLLAAKAKVNEKDKYGQTALFRVGNNVEIAKLLLVAKATVNLKDSEGLTPLMCAGPEVIKLLIKAKANVNARDIDGKTALMRILSGSPGDRNEESIKILKARGGDRVMPKEEYAKKKRLLDAM